MSKPTVRVTLMEGTQIKVDLHETDGEFDLIWDKTGIRVEANLPDPAGREGVIYYERFGSEDHVAGLDQDGPVEEVRDIYAPMAKAHAERLIECFRAIDKLIANTGMDHRDARMAFSDVLVSAAGDSATAPAVRRMLLAITAKGI